MPQNEIKMSAPLSHTLNIKGCREIYMAGARAERNAKLPHSTCIPRRRTAAPPTLSLLIISEHLGIKPTAATRPAEWRPARRGGQTGEETIARV